MIRSSYQGYCNPKPGSKQEANQKKDESAYITAAQTSLVIHLTAVK